MAQSGQIIVRVLEDATNATLEGALVEIDELSIKDATDSSGRLVLRDVPAGEYTLEVSYRGLPDFSTPVTVTEEQPTRQSPFAWGPKKKFSS